MEVKIKCLITSTIDNIIYDIYVYKKNKLLYKLKSDKKGNTCFKVNNNGFYTIKIVPSIFLNPQIICKNIYVADNKCNQFNFYFEKNTIKPKKITFNVTDKFYKDLPIQKGELKLWHNT